MLYDLLQLTLPLVSDMMTHGALTLSVQLPIYPCEDAEANSRKGMYMLSPEDQ